MTDGPIRKLVIAGGGSAGWMTAALLSAYLDGNCAITLIESPEIGTVGVGEATIPPIKQFNRLAGIKEAEFLRRTNGTFKLGIEFVDWGALGESYIHPFGRYGLDFDRLPFRQHWLNQRINGAAAPLEEYSLSASAARSGRFALPGRDRRTIGSTLDYAYHFDANAYAAFLREIATERGVVHREGRIETVERDGTTGDITSLVLNDGQIVEGDFFIDCTGFRALLIGQALGAEFSDWSHWLPCDRAVAVPSANTGMLLPHTRSIAHTAGWSWRIPLQHRVGNGHVFCSAKLSEDEATSILLKGLDGEALAEPRTLRFATGCRRDFWRNNCVAIGLSAGFLEPLESTSLHLIQSALMRLLTVFPTRGDNTLLIEQFNRRTRAEFERVRDFIILHYHATKRDDSELWRYCAAMDIPEPLREKIENFRAHSLFVSHEEELFQTASWLSVLIGQGIIPRGAPAMTAFRTGIAVSTNLDAIKAMITSAVGNMGSHGDFIDSYCRSTA